MIKPASLVSRTLVALAAGLLLTLPGFSRIGVQPSPLTVYADDERMAARDDLEEEGTDDEDSDEVDLSGLMGVTPSQIQRATWSPNAIRTINARSESGFYCLDFVDHPGFTGPRVGFERADDNTCQVNAVYQTLLSFEERFGDIRPQWQLGKLQFLSATLSWSDKRIVTPEMKGASCVAFVSRPSQDWVGLDTPNRMPNTQFAGPVRKTSWDVQDLVQEWMGDPVKAKRGLVLRGLDDSLDHSDGTTCFSQITNPRIKLVYTVPLASAPAPAQPTGPTKPDLVLTAIRGPKEVANGTTAVYDIVLGNKGTAARNTAQVQINGLGNFELVDMTLIPAGFDCQLSQFGFSCRGSLGGINDAIQTQTAVFRVQVRATDTGAAHVLGSANHDGALDEMPGENNLVLYDVTVK